MVLLNNALFGALLLAIPSTVLALPAPPNSDLPAVEIILQNISYESHTRFWGPGSVRTGIATVDFNIANAQAPKLHCAALTSEGGANDAYFKYVVPMTYHCDTPSGETRTPANFTFSRFYNEITVNQTWNGPPIGGYIPTYKAWVSGNATLECTSKVWTNPDWTPGVGGGIDYSTRDDTCKGVDLKMRVDQVSAVL